MDLLPLTIFPDGGLSSSVITTVWVGVFVLCFFNLRFGWVLSGLVVPGYLVPLVIVKPLAAVVIVVEAVLAYMLVWLFSEKLSRGRFPSLFGRDRFMGLILASIAVRLSMDGLILPEFAGWLEENFDRRFDWRDNLQSFGLVIISLLANQFWKPGLARGLVAAMVTIGLTWFIVRYGLMEFTNFRMSGVSYLYEGLASSILASPKAYIILTLTALIASHMNVRYGWDFSGILIPALIALQWYQPAKILTSFAEAIVIYCIARLILKLPMMANVTLEGGRKLLLFFNISFAWKMALGWFIVWQGLEIKTTDFYGFGYLLSTLIAIKAHDKDIFPRLARSTLQVSLAGAVLGNIAGFALSAVTARLLIAQPASAEIGEPASDPLLAALVIDAVGDAHVRKVRQSMPRLEPEAASALADLVELMEAGLPEAAPRLDIASEWWRVRRLADGSFAITRAQDTGKEVLLFNPDASRDIALVLSDPAAAPGLGIAALELRRNQDARWLVLGAPRSIGAISDLTVVDAFAAASGHAKVSIEPATTDSSRIMFANRGSVAANLAALRAVLPDMEVALAGLAGTTGNEGIWQLSADSVLRLASTSLQPESPRSVRCRIARTNGSQTRWSDLTQLAFLRYEIAQPMIAAAREDGDPALARAAARLGGYNLERCNLAGRDHLSLTSTNRPEGQVLLALGAKDGGGIITYRDAAQTRPARIGATLHHEFETAALFISPFADDPFRLASSGFDVLWQEWVRASMFADKGVVVQLRPRPLSAPVIPRNVDMVLVPDRLGTPPAELDEILSSARKAGLRPELSDGSRRFAGFETRRAAATRYFDLTPGRRHLVGWLRREETAQVKPAP